MKIPNFLALKNSPEGEGNSYAQHMHPDPRFYKYQWWIFWRESPCDGREFLTDAYSVSTAEAMALIDRLVLAKESHWIYNKSAPRHDPGVSPFDPTSRKWKDTQFAPAFDKDMDPLWDGFK